MRPISASSSGSMTSRLRCSVALVFMHVALVADSTRAASLTQLQDTTRIERELANLKPSSAVSGTRGATPLHYYTTSGDSGRLALARGRQPLDPQGAAEEAAPSSPSSSPAPRHNEQGTSGIRLNNGDSVGDARPLIPEEYRWVAGSFGGRGQRRQAKRWSACGSGEEADAWGRCCAPAALDARGRCCAPAALDSAAACLDAPPPAPETRSRPARLAARLPAYVAALLGMAPGEAEAVRAEAPGEGAAARRRQSRLLLQEAPGPQEGGTTNATGDAIQSALNQTLPGDAAGGSTGAGAVTNVEVDSTNRVGACGNGVCEVRETSADCPEDCPFTPDGCPKDSSGRECGGAGVCKANTGTCSCYTGYTGEVCEVMNEPTNGGLGWRSDVPEEESKESGFAQQVNIISAIVVSLLGVSIVSIQVRKIKKKQAQARAVERIKSELGKETDDPDRTSPPRAAPEEEAGSDPDPGGPAALAASSGTKSETAADHRLDGSFIDPFTAQEPPVPRKFATRVTKDILHAVPHNAWLATDRSIAKPRQLPSVIAGIQRGRSSWLVSSVDGLPQGCP